MSLAKTLLLIGVAEYRDPSHDIARPTPRFAPSIAAGCRRARVGEFRQSRAQIDERGVNTVGQVEDSAGRGGARKNRGRVIPPSPYCVVRTRAANIPVAPAADCFHHGS